MDPARFAQDVLLVGGMLEELARDDEHEAAAAAVIDRITKKIVDGLCVQFELDYKTLLDATLVEAEMLKYELRFYQRHSRWPDDDPQGQ